MNNLNFSVFINAPREKVWHAMLDDATYREWTKVFNPTSFYRGDWSEGSKMLFIGIEEKTGEEGGMVSMIKENRQNEYISIEHLGFLVKGKEELWGEEKKGLENYAFVDKDGGTEVKVELTNVPSEYSDMMAEMWPKSLEVLKQIAER